MITIKRLGTIIRILYSLSKYLIKIQNHSLKWHNADTMLVKKKWIPKYVQVQHKIVVSKPWRTNIFQRKIEYGIFIFKSIVLKKNVKKVFLKKLWLKRENIKI